MNEHVIITKLYPGHVTEPERRQLEAIMARNNRKHRDTIQMAPWETDEPIALTLWVPETTAAQLRDLITDLAKAGFID